MADLKRMEGDMAAMRRELDTLKRGAGGVNAENLQQFFVMHRHGGDAMGGGNLYGPYFIRDEADGNLYKIICTNGVLSAELAS